MPVLASPFVRPLDLDWWTDGTDLVEIRVKWIDICILAFLFPQLCNFGGRFLDAQLGDGRSAVYYLKVPMRGSRA